MNKDLEFILSACEKPFILAPDNLSIIDGNIFAVCNNISGEASSFPIIISSVQSPSSNSSIIDNNVLISETGTPIVNLQQSATASVVMNNGNASVSETPLLSNNTKLSCKICGKQFTREENLTFHEKTHANSNLFHCNTCSKSFVTSKSLIEHLTSHQMKDSNVPDKRLEECEICGKYFHKSCITEHEKGYKDQILFYCRYCELSFCKKGLLIYHLKLHSDKECKTKEQQVYECGFCKTEIPQTECENNLSTTYKRKTVGAQSRKLETPPILERQSESKRLRRGRPPKHLNKMPVLEPEVHKTNIDILSIKTDQILENLDLVKDSQSKHIEEAIVISDDENDIIDDNSSSIIKKSLTFQSYSSCEVCLKFFSNNKLLLEHSREHLELQCIDCGQCFSRIHDMLQHEELFHKVQCYICMKCNKNIALKYNFIEHILSHNSKSLQVCKVCYLYLFQKYTKYLARFKLFIGRRPFQCDICCKILQTVNKETLRCYICTDQFYSEPFLQEHRKENGLSNIKCVECNKYFHTIDDFEVHAAEAKNNCVVSHKRQIFSINSDYNCVKCFMEFPTEEELQKHCLDVEHYKCSNCDERFSDWEDFNSHLVLYPVLPCTGCKSFILGEHSLKKHKNDCSQISCASMQSATNFDDSKNLLCIECNVTFSKKECLIEHIIFMH